MVTLAAQAQRQQISYIEETKNWYYVYDEQGKRIGGLSRSSIGELKGWGNDFFVAKRYSYYYICDAKGKTLKTMNVSDVGEIVGVTNMLVKSLVSPIPPSPAAKAVGYSHGTKRERKSVQEVLIEKKLLAGEWPASF